MCTGLFVQLAFLARQKPKRSCDIATCRAGGNNAFLSKVLDTTMIKSILSCLLLYTQHAEGGEGFSLFAPETIVTTDQLKLMWKENVQAATPAVARQLSDAM